MASTTNVSAVSPATLMRIVYGDLGSAGAMRLMVHGLVGYCPDSSIRPQ